MPRIARVVAIGQPHHITQRGNYQQEVFLSADNRKQYLAWINEYSVKYGVSILAYCLMLNHVHFIAVPYENDSLAKTFNTAHMRYAQYLNKKLKQRGHLWQGRFYSCVLDQSHLILAARYIERNPARAGIVDKPWQWLWSSAALHTGRENDGLIKLGDLFRIIDMSSVSWEKYIDSAEEDNFLQNIRKHTYAGRPLGAPEFTTDLEEKCGRRLCALPIGRPRVLNRDSDRFSGRFT
ncbi:MAG: transposase [Candidatus Omnitrophica bacterium]|nr:transposase [Candidatus Omnitrophota bacterium]